MSKEQILCKDCNYTSFHMYKNGTIQCINCGSRFVLFPFPKINILEDKETGPTVEMEFEHDETGNLVSIKAKPERPLYKNCQTCGRRFELSEDQTRLIMKHKVGDCPINIPSERQPILGKTECEEYHSMPKVKDKK